MLQSLGHPFALRVEREKTRRKLIEARDEAIHHIIVGLQRKDCFNINVHDHFSGGAWWWSTKTGPQLRFVRQIRGAASWGSFVGQLRGAASWG